MKVVKNKTLTKSSAPLPLLEVRKHGNCHACSGEMEKPSFSVTSSDLVPSGGHLQHHIDLFIRQATIDYFWHEGCRKDFGGRKKNHMEIPTHC